MNRRFDKIVVIVSISHHTDDYAVPAETSVHIKHRKYHSELLFTFIFLYKTSASGNRFLYDACFRLCLDNDKRYNVKL